MNHQPFETWLLGDERLEPEQHRELEHHLQDCQTCRDLSAAWHSVLPMMRNIELLAPEAGFSARWQVRLEREKFYIHRRQTWFVFLVSLGAATLFLFVLTVLVAYSYSTPIDWVLGFVGNLTAFISFTNAMQQVLAILTSLIPATWLVIFSAFLAILSIFWIAMLNKYTGSKRIVL